MLHPTQHNAAGDNITNETKTMTAIINRNCTGRRRTRIVDQDRQIRNVVEKARKSGGVAFDVDHGGTVANAYKYPAITDAVGTVAIIHNGVEHVWSEATTIAANKATCSGAAAATIGYRLFDGRMSDASDRAMKSKLLCEAAAKLAVWE